MNTLSIWCKTLCATCAVMLMVGGAHAAKKKDVPEEIPPHVIEMLGVDVDNDGIRDDVQIHLMHAYGNQPDIFAAFRRLARIDHILMRHSYDKKQNVKHYREWATAYACFERDFSQQFARQAAYQLYQRTFYNTIPRVNAMHIVERYKDDFWQNTPRSHCDAN